MAKFRPDYVPSRGTGNGTLDDDRNIISELGGRVGKKHWGDLPESCQTGCSSNLRELKVRQDGQVVSKIVEGKTKK